MPRTHICLLKISQKKRSSCQLAQWINLHFPHLSSRNGEDICKWPNKCYSLRAFCPWRAYGMLLEKKRGCSRAVIMAFCKVFFSTFLQKHNFHTTSANMANSMHSISTSQSYNGPLSTSFWFFPNHGFHPQEEPILSTWVIPMQHVVLHLLLQLMDKHPNNQLGWWMNMLKLKQ